MCWKLNCPQRSSRLEKHAKGFGNGMYTSHLKNFFCLKNCIFLPSFLLKSRESTRAREREDSTLKGKQVTAKDNSNAADLFVLWETSLMSILKCQWDQGITNPLSQLMKKKKPDVANMASCWFMTPVIIWDKNWKAFNQITEIINKFYYKSLA